MLALRQSDYGFVISKAVRSPCLPTLEHDMRNIITQVPAILL